MFFWEQPGDSLWEASKASPARVIGTEDGEASTTATVGEHRSDGVRRSGLLMNWCFQGNTDLKNEVQSVWPTPQESSKVSIYSLGYAYACSGVETESFTFARRGTKAVK